MSLLMHTLHVDLAERSYPVYIGRDLFTDSELLSQHVAGSQVVIVSNETVAPLYLDRVRNALRPGTYIRPSHFPFRQLYLVDHKIPFHL